MNSLMQLAPVGPKTIAEQIERSQEYLQWNDDQMAEAIGYTSGRVIAMIKKGTMRLPINKVYVLATAIDIEPGQLMRMALREIDPEMLKSIEDCFGPLTLKPTEVRLINSLRERAKGKEIATMMLEPDSLVAFIMA